MSTEEKDCAYPVRRYNSRPWKFQSLIASSKMLPLVSRKLPSGEHARAITASECALKLYNSLPSKFQDFTTSSPAVSTVFPSCVKATEETTREYPAKFLSSSPCRFHNFTCLSILPVKIYWPSGEKSREIIGPWCPLKFCTTWPDISQSLTTPSFPPVRR